MARSPHGLPAQGLAATRAYGQLGVASWRASSRRIAAGANNTGSGPGSERNDRSAMSFSIWTQNNSVPISSDAEAVPLQEIVLAILQPAPLACCRWELERRQMIPPSNFALRFIVEEDPSLVRQLNARYADAAPDGGLEPEERDALFDVLARHYTGRPWPRGGDMRETRRFLADLHRAMTDTRWRVAAMAMA